MDLYERLMDLNSLPMHMPGHKRRTDLFPWLAPLGGALDITEIPGFDNLNDPETVFAEAQRRAASLWGAGESILLVGGSTLGILASVWAVMSGKPGSKLLMCRGSHRSVYSAAELAGCGTVYLTPPRDPVLGHWLSVSPESVSEALRADESIGLVCITSPTYEGVLSDVRAVSRVCHDFHVPLLVDEAHGAHLSLPGFPEGAVRQGADLVVQSLHKTLPSLTQTAILHRSGDLVPSGELRRAVAMLQSSSPSYLLSASICGCVSYLEEQGGEASARWLNALEGFRRDVSGMTRLRLSGEGPGVFGSDPSKLLISTAYSSVTGPELAELLRQRGIEPEMSSPRSVLCMTGMGDTTESLSRLARTLNEIDAGLECRDPEPLPDLPLPARAMDIRTALSSKTGPVPLSEAEGRICGEYVWAYPPGAPMVVPGEVLDGPAVRELTRPGLRSTFGELPKSVFCVLTE